MDNQEVNSEVKREVVEGEVVEESGVPLKKEEMAIVEIKNKAPIISEQNLFLINNTNINQMIENVKCVAKLVESCRRAALVITTNEDWTNQYGKPYLGASGCQRLRAFFNVYVKDVKKKEYLDKEGFPVCDFEGIIGAIIKKSTLGLLKPGEEDVELFHPEGYFFGGRTGKDEFFRKRKDGWLSAEEVDKSQLRGTAYSNFEANGISRLLGFRNLIWQELAQYGIQQSKVATFDYKGKPKASASVQKETQKPVQSVQGEVKPPQTAVQDEAIKLYFKMWEIARSQKPEISREDLSKIHLKITGDKSTKNKSVEEYTKIIEILNKIRAREDALVNYE